MAEHWLRVHFEDSAYTTVPVTPMTTAAGICATLHRKRGVPAASHALYVTDAAHEHVYERRLGDAERPIEVQEKSRKAGNLDHFRIIFKLIEMTQQQQQQASNAAGSTSTGTGAGSDGFPARGEAGMFDEDDPPVIGSLPSASDLHGDEPDFASTPVAQSVPASAQHQHASSLSSYPSSSASGSSLSTLFSSDPSVLRCGYLDKRGKRYTAWKERFFKHPQTMPFIAAPSITNLTTSPPLPVPHSHSSLTKCSYAFEIHTIVRVFYLRARSYPEMLNWIREIEAVIPPCAENAVLDDLDDEIGQQEEASNSRDDAYLVSLSHLSGVLSNGIGVEQFVQFETERAVPSGGERTVLAYLECEGWRKQAQSGVKPRVQMLERARGIYQRFFSPEAPERVQWVSEEQRRQVEQHLAASLLLLPSLFASVTGSLFSHLSTHSFPAFAMSKHFQRAALKLQMLGEQTAGGGGGGGGAASAAGVGQERTEGSGDGSAGASTSSSSGAGKDFSLSTRARQATTFPDRALPMIGHVGSHSQQQGSNFLGAVPIFAQTAAGDSKLTQLSSASPTADGQQDEEKTTHDTKSTTTLLVTRSEFSTSASSESLSSLGDGGDGKSPSPLASGDPASVDSSYSISEEISSIGNGGPSAMANLSSGLLSGLYGVGSAAIGAVGALVPGQSPDASGEDGSVPRSNGPSSSGGGKGNLSPRSLAAYLERVGEADAKRRSESVVKKSAATGGGACATSDGGSASAKQSSLSSPSSTSKDTSAHTLSSVSVDADGGGGGASSEASATSDDDDDESGAEDRDEERSIFDEPTPEERSTSGSMAVVTDAAASISSSTGSAKSRRKQPVGLFDTTPRTSEADCVARSSSKSNGDTESMLASIIVSSVSEEDEAHDVVAPVYHDDANERGDLFADDAPPQGRSRSMESAWRDSTKTTTAPTSSAIAASASTQYLGVISELDVRSASNSTSAAETRPRQLNGSSASTYASETESDLAPSIDAFDSGAPRVTHLTSRQPVENRRRSSAMTGGGSTVLPDAVNRPTAQAGVTSGAHATSKWKSKHQARSIFDDDDEEDLAPSPARKPLSAKTSAAPTASSSASTARTGTSSAGANVPRASGSASSAAVALDLSSLGEAVDVGDLNLDDADAAPAAGIFDEDPDNDADA